MRNLKRVAALVAVIMCCVTSLTVSATGEMPQVDSYQYSYWKDAVAAPTAYELTASVDAKTLGISVGELSDVCCSENGTVYLLDRGKDCIIKLNSDYTLSAVVDSFTYNGTIESFSSPEGIFVNSEGDIYIADTTNARVVILDSDFNCISIIGDPAEKALLDYDYQPIKVCGNEQGHIFVISRNETQGILQFSRDGGFMGYLGATRVVPSITEMFYRAFATRKQLKSMLRSIPTEYNNLTIDEDGFIYGTVSSLNSYTILSDIDSGGSSAAPVRKINASGDDILVRNGKFPPVGELVFKVIYGADNDYDGPSQFIDVASTDNGVYSLLDAKRGRVFTYNTSGELLYIFGSRGSKLGQLETPSAIDYQGKNIMIVDSKRNQLQVFAPTDYVNNILSAIDCYRRGDYENEQKYWKKVLYEYSGSDMAYVGIGKSYYNRQDYKTAMSYFKQGNNREYYSKAFKEYRKELGRAITPYILLVLAVVTVLAIIVCFVFKKRKRIDLVINNRNFKCRKFGELFKGFKYGFHICCHPFDGFWDVKYEHRGSIGSATLILVLTMAVSVLTSRFTPYLFNDINFSKENILFSSVISVLGPVVLWCVSNWCFTTLMDGKGTIKDIYIFTCYSLYPRLLIHPILLGLSFMMSLDESAFYTLFMLISQLWVVFLIFCGTLQTHHYTAVKTVLSIILTIVGIAIIVFIGLLVVTLLQQVIEFVKTLSLEISLRI